MTTALTLFRLNLFCLPWMNRFLVYVDRNEDGSSPMGIQERFRFDDFVKGMGVFPLVFQRSLCYLIHSQPCVHLYDIEQPSEWRPLLESLRDSQAFSNFIDDRIALNKLDRGNVLSFMQHCRSMFGLTCAK